MTVTFGPFVIEVEEGTVTRDGQTVPLTPKEFDTLCALIEANGKLVRKEDLVARVWPDSYVGDGSLARNISILRKALGEDVIETVPRRGYRLMVPVTSTATKPHTLPGMSDTAVSSSCSEPANLARISESTRTLQDSARWVVLASAVLIIFFASSLLKGHFSSSNVRANSRSVRIAVLPFANYTGLEQEEYLCDGLTEQMISELSRWNPVQLAVVARTSSMAYKGTHKSIAEIARELKADFVLESSVRSAVDRLRISTHLVKASDGTDVWTGEYDRDLRDALDLQQQISTSVASEIRIHLSSSARTRLAKVHSIDPEAFRNYLMGRFYWNKRNEDGLLKAVNYFNQAIARDPTYARAYAGLADAYLVLGGGYLPDLEAYGKAREAAIKAIELDDSLPEAYASLAYEEFVHERDWHRAEENFRKSIALDPEYPIAHAWYALYLVAMSRGDEAVEEIDRALELDPLSLPVAYNAGSIHFLTGRRDEGVALARKALEIDPNCAPAHGGLASDYLNMGDFQKAIDEFRRAQELRAGYSPYAVEIAHVYAVEGKKNEAHRALARLLSDPGWGKVAPYTFAVTYAALGQKNEAFKWLQKSVDDHSCTVMEVNTDRSLDPLRSDPRFIKIRAQFGLRS